MNEIVGAGVYTGQMLGGKRDGVGQMKFNDGSSFQGEWKEDMFHGAGKLTHKNGDITEGNWT